MKKVLLFPSKPESWELPQQYNTVEAEYGDYCVNARGGITLAHHGPRANNPAPCIAAVTPNDLPIIVSHMDLDTIGGILAIWEEKPEDQAFWQAAAFIDVNGPHHVNELREREASMLRAYWAWTEKNRLPRFEEATDVTTAVLEAADVVRSIVAENEHLLAKGTAWAASVEQATEACLVRETPDIRVFVTDGVFCSASYYSPRFRTVAKATVVLNKQFDAITVAFEDGGTNHSAKEIVQQLWGSEAGGHNGIAGSPRGQVMTEEDFRAAIRYVEDLVQSCSTCMYCGEPLHGSGYEECPRCGAI